MNEEIKVSVIVPIYNVEKFVSKCIESILTQTHKNLEIILVDDGSSDNSGRICDEYSAKDERIVVIHKENGGVSVARNSGIDKATGDYICFVDGDDYVMEDYVDYMLELCTKYDSEMSIVNSFFTTFDTKQNSSFHEELLTSEDAVESILCNRILIGCNNKLFRKDLLENIRFVNGLPIGEGFNFNIEVFQEAKIVAASNKRIYFYRKDNENSVMSSFSLFKYEEGLRAIQLIKGKLKFNSNRINLAWKYANWRTHSDFYDVIMLSNAKGKYPEFYNKCYKKTKKDAFIALKVPCSNQDKIRALIMKVCPALIPMAMRLRKMKYHVNVNS